NFLRNNLNSKAHLDILFILFVSFIKSYFDIRPFLVAFFVKETYNKSEHMNRCSYVKMNNRS
ncbi:hypothetical protein, partial [Clostridium perfringens]|uniref:hypothetical protein n=1 Tax=Clostridium perfringens TaxID=1502 RepID=UPI003F420912